MYQVTLSKSIVRELECKLDGLANDWNGDEEQGKRYSDLADKMYEHSLTDCKHFIIMDAWECEACADELENSAAAQHDNGFISVASKYRKIASELRAKQYPTNNWK